MCVIMVRETGLEPVWKNHTPLKRARLPVPPLSHIWLLSLLPCDGFYYIPSFQKCQYFFENFSKNFLKIKFIFFLDKNQKLIYNIFDIISYFRGVAQLVARLLWEQNAAGSSPVTPTK